MITPMLATRGKLDLSDNTISFTVNADFEHEFKEQIEKQAKLMENNKRLYILRLCGQIIALFFLKPQEIP